MFGESISMAEWQNNWSCSSSIKEAVPSSRFPGHLSRHDDGLWNSMPTICANSAWWSWSLTYHKQQWWQTREHGHISLWQYVPFCRVIHKEAGSCYCMLQREYNHPQHEECAAEAGGSDCGVIAIALATALANNINPYECCFKQDAMRDHLWRCLESGKLTMFPLVKCRMPRKVVRHVDIIELYCSCQMPEVPPMVECSKCKEWYHIKCVSVPKRALENQSIDWYCKNC